MTIEVMDIRITDRQNGTVRMTARDVSEEHLQYLERYRDDGFESEIEYEWVTADTRQMMALRRWLKNQKATQTAKTYGEALQAVIGIMTQSPSGRYRVWE